MSSMSASVKSSPRFFRIHLQRSIDTQPAVYPQSPRHALATLYILIQRGSMSVQPVADPDVHGTKRGSGSCAPSGCAGGRVPAEGLGAKSPRSCGINAFYECRNLKNSFLSLHLFSLTFKNIFYWSSRVGGGAIAPARTRHCVIPS